MTNPALIVNFENDLVVPLLGERIRTECKWREHLATRPTSGLSRLDREST